jgi:hypothetical protein
MALNGNDWAPMGAIANLFVSFDLESQLPRIHLDQNNLADGWRLRGIVSCLLGQNVSIAVVCGGVSISEDVALPPPKIRTAL